jgi:hypothetical protein
VTEGPVNLLESLSVARREIEKAETHIAKARDLYKQMHEMLLTTVTAEDATDEQVQTSKLRHDLKIGLMHAVILKILYERKMITKEGLWQALYGHKPEASQPTLGVIGTHFYNLRQSLQPFGIHLVMERGGVIYIEPEDKKKLDKYFKKKVLDHV